MTEINMNDGKDGGKFLTIFFGVIAGIFIFIFVAPYLFLGIGLQYRDQEALKESGFILPNGQFVFHQLHTGLFSEDHFSDGLLFHKYGPCFDRSGNQVFNIKISDLEPFSEGLAAVQLGSNKSERWGFLDKTGRFAIEASFQNAHSFNNGLAPVQSSGKWGYIKKNGEWAIKPIYDKAHIFSEERAAICLDGKIGYIDTKGNIIVKPAYDVGMPFSEGVAQVANFGTESNPGDIFYFDKTGKKLFQVDKSIRHTSNPKGYYSSAGSIDFYDPDSFQVNGKNYEYRADNAFHHPNEQTQKFRYDRQQFSCDKRFGYLNKQGKTVIPFQFDSAMPFSEGVACVSKDKLFGFIDENGNYIFEKRFESASNFHDGLAFVTVTKGNSGFINKSGNIVIPVKCGQADDFYEGLAMVGPLMVYP